MYLELIIKLTIIVALSILAGFTIYKFTKILANNQNDSCSNLKTILICIGVVIAILSVAIITITMADNKSAFENFSFAATVTSIILSVIAIIMTIISEGRQETTKTILNNSVSKLNETCSTIESLRTMIDEEEEKFLKILEEIKKISIENHKIHDAIIKNVKSTTIDGDYKVTNDNTSVQNTQFNTCFSEEQL